MLTLNLNVNGRTQMTLNLNVADESTETTSVTETVAATAVIEGPTPAIATATTPGEKLLVALNDPRFKWRTLEALAEAADVDEDEARDLLEACSDVRTSKNDGDLYGLVSRVGE